MKESKRRKTTKSNNELQMTKGNKKKMMMRWNKNSNKMNKEMRKMTINKVWMRIWMGRILTQKRVMLMMNELQINAYDFYLNFHFVYLFKKSNKQQKKIIKYH